LDNLNLCLERTPLFNRRRDQFRPTTKRKATTARPKPRRLRSMPTA